MINLRIQEIAEAKGLSLEELSKLSGISPEDIRAYSSLETLTEEKAANLRKIAAKLNVPVLELVKPVAKKVAFKLNILEIAKNRGLTLQELSKISGVEFDAIAFYSTQAIYKQKISETPCQESLRIISKALDCSIEDLQVEADLPVNKLRFEAFTDEKDLSLEDISLLTNASQEFINLLATQPVDVDIVKKLFKDIPDDANEICKAFCKIIGCSCP